MATRPGQTHDQADALVRPHQITDEQSGTGDLLELLDARPAWHAGAACRRHPSAWWFPAKGEPTGPAKTVCGTCPVRQHCLDWALAQGPDLAGIWGATSPADRAVIRRHAAA